MTLYNVTGIISVLSSSKETAAAVLCEKAAQTELDIVGEKVITPNTPEPITGYGGSAVLAGQFEAASEEAARERFINRVFRRTGAFPRLVLAFESNADAQPAEERS